MTNMQRMRSDIATMDRRHITDKTIRDNRIKNDELTEERRSQADKTMGENRLRNDQITSDRRERNDANPSMALAVFLLILLGLAVGLFFVFV